MAYVLGTGLIVALGVYLLTGGREASSNRTKSAGRVLRRDGIHLLVSVGESSAGNLVGRWSSASTVCREWRGYFDWGLEGISASRGLYLIVFMSSGLVFAFVLWSLPAYALGPVCMIGWTVVRAKSIQAMVQKNIEREVPDVLRTMATSIGSGQTLPQAIAYVGARGSGPISTVFAQANFSLMCGCTVSQVLADIENELRVPGIEMLVMALDVSKRTGAPLGSLLMHSAELVESQAAMRQSLQTKTAQVRLSARVVMTLPCILVLVLMLMSSDFREGLATVPGFVSLCIAALLDAVAFLVMKTLMRKVGL